MTVSVFSSLSLSADISWQDFCQRIFGLQFGFPASKWQWLLAHIGSVSASVLLKEIFNSLVEAFYLIFKISTPFYNLIIFFLSLVSDQPTPSLSF